MTGLPCPTCGAELAFLEQYQRHFCYHCQQYAPEGYGAKGEKKCPSCGGILSYVPQYDRFYCYRCSTYPAVEPESTPSPGPTPEKPPEAAPTVAAPEPTSAGAPTPVEQALTTIPPTPKPKAEETPEVKVVEAPISDAKPPLVREEILEAKKPVLMDLLKAYDLDPSGTKEQLRERLLSYLDELEGEERPEEPLPAPEPEPEAISQEPAPKVTVEAAPAQEPRGQAGVTAVVIQEEPPAEPKAELVPEVVHEPAPQPAPAPEPWPVVTPAPAPAPSLPPRVAHPCPTCGRELEYISQYNRWYCYSCKAYAPAIAPKNACPSCGATLRWIEKYSRWWCDSCHSYAPADLPAPRSAAAATAAATRPSAQVEEKTEVAVHHHRSPTSGIGLAGFGLALWVIYEILVEVPRVFTVDLGFALDRDYAFFLQFFGFSFLAIGVILALAALKDRR